MEEVEVAGFHTGPSNFKLSACRGQQVEQLHDADAHRLSRLEIEPLATTAQQQLCTASAQLPPALHSFYAAAPSSAQLPRSCPQLYQKTPTF